MIFFSRRRRHFIMRKLLIPFLQLQIYFRIPTLRCLTFRTSNEHTVQNPASNEILHLYWACSAERMGILNYLSSTKLDLNPSLVRVFRNNILRCSRDKCTLGNSNKYFCVQWCYGKWKTLLQVSYYLDMHSRATTLLLQAKLRVPKM